MFEDMPTFTWEDLLFNVWKKALDNPDHVDPYANEESCKYASHDELNYGGCIVGQSLQDIGVHEDVLDELDVEATAISQWSFKDVFDLEGTCPKFLEVVQQSQDKGLSWGDALEQALEADPESFEKMLEFRRVSELVTFPQEVEA